MSTALEKRSQAKETLAFLDSYQDKIQEAAAEGMDAKRLIRVFGGLATRVPKIYECTKESIINCMVLCAQTGMEPGGYPPLVHLIPRRNKKTNSTELNWQLDYRGLCHLAERSGKVVRIHSAPVFDWEVEQGLFEFQIEPPECVHRFSLDPGPMDAANVVGAYAVAELVGGVRVQIFLNKSQIEDRRKRGGARDFSPWSTDYPAMARKSAIRALLSGGSVPLQREARAALEGDADHWAAPIAVNPQRVTMSRSARHAGAFRVALAKPQDEPPADVIEIAEESQEIDWAGQWLQACEQYAATEKDMVKAVKAAKVKTIATEDDYNAAVAALEEVLGC